jgi:hypothetical protein
MLTLEDFISHTSDPEKIKAGTERYNSYIARSNAIDKILLPVNQELQALGFSGKFNQIEIGKTPPEFFPIFARHLELDDLYIPEVEINGQLEVFDLMENISDRFYQSNASPYWDLLLDRFNFTKDKPERKNYRDSLIQALTYTTLTPNQQLKMIDMLLDPTEGDCRLLMLDWLKKPYHPTFQKVFETLVENDPVMRTKILSWKPYWKKHNPELLEKWGKAKPKK